MYTRISAEPCERIPSASNACGFGWQAFNIASAFNANIGAWNTASVSNMQSVCAAFSARAARPLGRDALGGSSVRRGPLWAAGPPMRARAWVCADVWARACAGAHVRRYSCAYERRVICMYAYVCIYLYRYVCMHYTYPYIGIYIYVHVRAIARADDAAGDIVCVCVPACICRHARMRYVYISIYSPDVHMRACMV